MSAEHAPGCEPVTVGGCSCGAALFTYHEVPAGEPAPTLIPGSDPGLPEARELIELRRLASHPIFHLLETLRDGEIKSLKLERAGELYRITCARGRGTPLTTLDRDPIVALRLALQEIAEP